MTPPSIPPNAYTHAPEQHPNLIVGSLQLLFWLVFRPSAWKHHIQRLDPSLGKNFSLLRLLTQQRWRQSQIWRFLIQGLFLLPTLIILITGLVSLILGVPMERVVWGVALGVASVVVFGWVFAMVGVVRGVTGSMALGVLCVAVSGVIHSVALRKLLDLAFIRVGESVALGEILGVAESMALGVALGTSLGMAFGVAFDVLEGEDVGVGGSLIIGVISGATFGVMSSRTFGVAFGVVFGGAFSIGWSVNWWRPVLMSRLLIPWHAWLYTLDRSWAGRLPSVLYKHLAFWDEWQYLPILGLEQHLAMILERSPVEGQAALNYLSTSRQRWAVQAAPIELDARQLERCADASAIALTHRTLTVGELEGPADALFRSFNRISEDVEAAVNQTSVYNQRLALNAVGDRLDGLLRELTRSSDKYAVRFRPIAQRWSNIIALQLDDLTKAAEQRQEIDSPYIIGVPLTERQEIFVGRTDITSRIEQLLRDRRSPPLLLYGQRRTGKTSLLNNLGRLLPNSIIPMFVDLQGPASSASDHTGLLYNLARSMATSANRHRSVILPELTRELLDVDPFTVFDEWLDRIEQKLGDSNILLTLDEFEALDRGFEENRFSDAAVLGMLRNLIQHRPRFKVLLAGSHTLEEFQRWSNYLINAQVLHLGYLKAAEARQLIEHPVQDFALRYEPDASQRVLDLTHGHPFLVQLLCAELIAFKNEQDPSVRRLATLADVTAAIAAALSSGSMFFSDLERNQVDANALAVLRYLAAQGEAATVSETVLASQFGDGWVEAIALLSRRELLELTPSGYCFQVELIRRWFTQ